MSKGKMLVTGANGAVGSYAPSVLGEYELILTDIDGDMERLDVRDPKAMDGAVRDLNPDVVLHLAAATDVDLCEKDPDWAYHSNAIGTQNVALACGKHGVPLVYVSTAGVFPGDKPDPYNEFDEPGPVNHYGVSKLAGEKVVHSLLTRYFIVRAGWMIGGGPKDKKFVAKICKLMKERKSIQVVNDKIGSCTYAKDLLSGIRRLLETDYYGLYHMVNGGHGSRYDVAVEIRKILDRSDVELVPVTSAYFPLPANRSRSEMMRNYKFELLGLGKQRSWREALKDYLASDEAAPLLG